MEKKIFSVQISEETLDKLKLFYSERITKSSERYVRYEVKSPTLVIKIYDTLKVVFSGVDAYENALIWGYEDTVFKCLDNHMGSDEVGTGDYFGPVCVCAAYVKKEDIKWLEELGINDSKKLSDEKIKEIVPQIIKRVTYASLTLDNIKYNQLVEKGFNQGMIKAYLHNKAFNALREKVNDTKCLTVLDMFVNEKAYYNYLKNEKNIAKNIHFETKAETYYPAVAVGSMIARYSFITKMQRLSKELDMAIPMGSSTRVDRFAAEVIKRYGEDKLKEVAKIHFQNTKRAMLIAAE